MKYCKTHDSMWNEMYGPRNVCDLGWARKEGNLCRFTERAPDSPKDGTPEWAYDEDGYCVCCGYGHWKFHAYECELRDALDAAEALQALRSTTDANPAS